MIERKAEIDYASVAVTTGPGIFIAGATTTLIAPSNGWDYMLIAIRATTASPTLSSRVVFTLDNILGGAASMRFVFLYGINVLIRCDPLTIASITMASSLAYDVTASMIRGDLLPNVGLSIY